MVIGRYHLLYLALLCSYSPAFSQYEDLIDAPDAPTRTKEEEGIICTIEGVQFDKKMGTTQDSKEINLVFLLTEKPSAYFNYYEPIKKAIVFDFYDTRIGESIMDAIREHPITNSSVEQFKLDLNKDVAGLRPDIRDVVRVMLFSNYDIEYELQEDYGVITMNFMWNKKIEKQFNRKKNAIYWQFPLAMGILGSGGYATYWYLERKNDEPKLQSPVEGWPKYPN